MKWDWPAWLYVPGCVGCIIMLGACGILAYCSINGATDDLSRCSTALNGMFFKSPCDSSLKKNMLPPDEFTSIRQFLKYLPRESRHEVHHFMVVSCNGCGSDRKWHPMRGNCLNVPNLASYEMGARVVNTQVNYIVSSKSAVTEFDKDVVLRLKEHRAVNPPDTCLMESVLPGKSWAPEGNSGSLTVKLVIRAIIIGFTIHHPPHAVLLPGFFSSAPKRMKFYGKGSLENKTDVFDFGEFEYSRNGLSSQSFLVQKFTLRNYSYVELEILENHGNPLFTTLHKLDVHGIVEMKPWFEEPPSVKQFNQKQIEGQTLPQPTGIIPITTTTISTPGSPC